MWFGAAKQNPLTHMPSYLIVTKISDENRIDLPDFKRKHQMIPVPAECGLGWLLSAIANTNRFKSWYCSVEALVLFGVSILTTQYEQRRVLGISRPADERRWFPSLSAPVFWSRGVLIPSWFTFCRDREIRRMMYHEWWLSGRYPGIFVFWESEPSEHGSVYFLGYHKGLYACQVFPVNWPDKMGCRICWCIILLLFSVLFS